MDDDKKSWKHIGLYGHAVGTFSGTSLSLRTDNAGGAGRSRYARAKMVHLACEEGGLMANSKQMQSWLHPLGVGLFRSPICKCQCRHKK